MSEIEAARAQVARLKDELRDARETITRQKREIDRLCERARRLEQPPLFPGGVIGAPSR